MEKLMIVIRTIWEIDDYLGKIWENDHQLGYYGKKMQKLSKIDDYLGKYGKMIINNWIIMGKRWKN